MKLVFHPYNLYTDIHPIDVDILYIYCMFNTTFKFVNIYCDDIYEWLHIHFYITMILIFKSLFICRYLFFLNFIMLLYI